MSSPHNFYLAMEINKMIFIIDSMCFFGSFADYYKKN